MTTTTQVTHRKPHPAKQSFASWQERQQENRSQRPQSRDVEVRQLGYQGVRAQRVSMAEPHEPSRPVVSAPQPAPEYKEVQLNKRYKSQRVGKTIHAYPVDVKKGKVILKRDLEAKDSYTESRAYFDKYFVLDEV